MLFWQFSNIIIYVEIVGKIPDHHLNVWLFSNQGDKIQILVESMGQICPVVLHLFGPCPLDLRIPLHSNVDLVFSNNLDIYDLVWKLPEQHFSVWLFCNPGNTIVFVLKFNEPRISEWNLPILHQIILHHPISEQLIQGLQLYRVC